MAEYDFTAINNATRGMTAGMKLAVAKGLVTQCANTLERFDNPLAIDAIQLREDMEVFHCKYKESSPSRKS